jgi:hypothetical protein
MSDEGPYHMLPSTSWDRLDASGNVCVKKSFGNKKIAGYQICQKMVETANLLKNGQKSSKFIKRKTLGSRF